MSNRDVIIYWKNIQFDVVLPVDKVWDFALAFGEAFALNDSHQGRIPSVIDKYDYHPNGYHVWVSVWVNKEQQFYDFLRDFCSKQGLSVREKDLKPGVE